MKRLALLASVGLALGFVQPASAADLAPVYKAPAAVASPYNWTGFYIGGNVGGAIAHNATTQTLAGVIGQNYVTLAPRGFIGGVQAGFNYQVNQWVFGLEADWQWSDQNDSWCSNCGSLPPGSQIAQKMPWFATVRGRVGHTFGSVLAYGTGGVAIGKVDTTWGCCFVTDTVSASATKTGWTAGGGIEAALTGNWSVKAEYLYLDLGSVSHTVFLPAAATNSTADSTVRSHVGRVGLNYRFGGNNRMVSGADPWLMPTTNWTGVYVGANLGYGVGRNPQTQTFTPAAPIATARTVAAPDGVLGGGQVGVNWQIGRFVLGAEADFQGTDQKDTPCRNCPPQPGNLTTTFEHKLPWFATVRGRAGVAAGPALLYVTGGLAVGEAKLEIVQNSTLGIDRSSFSDTRVGWTVGGGIETALWSNWSVKAEYLYLDLGSWTVTTPAGFNGSTTVQTDIRDHVFRAGVNYRFSSLGAAQVSKR